MKNNLTHLVIQSACAAALLISISACGGNYGTADGERVRAPQERDDRLAASRGQLLGEDGWTLFGGDDDESSKDGGTGIGVNGFLWRATLDTLSFMPISSADPFGGVILTDWYEDPKAAGERYKINAVILDKTLRADGVTVSVFKQRIVEGNWRDQEVADSLKRQLEDTILTRARELRIAHSK